MRTSCLSRKYAKFVCFLIVLVPPIHGNDRKNTKKALLNKWHETTCIQYPRKLGEKLPNTEVEYLRIHKPMRTSFLFFLNLANCYRFLKNFSFQIYKWTWQPTAAEINFGIKYTWAGLFFGCGGASNPLIFVKKIQKFVCFSVFCVPPIHDNARKSTKHKLFCT